MRKYLLLFCLSLPFMSYADVNPTKPNGLPNASYPDLRPTIDRHIAKVDGMRAGLKTMELEIKAYRGSADVTAKRNYPIVPYDPNHPNVKKQAKNFKLPVKAGTLAKNLGRGLNAAAMALALYDLIGAGVDYVLDPENNRVIIPSTSTNCWASGYSVQHGTVEDVHARMCHAMGGYNPSYKDKISENNQDVRYSAWCAGAGNAIIICPKPQPRDVSLDEIANKVIDLADQGNPDAKDAVRTAVLDDLTSGAYDDLIRQVANEDEGWELTDPTSDSDTDSGTSDNPVGSDNPKPDGSLPDDSDTGTDSETKPDDGKDEDSKGGFKLPAFCDWASWFCEDSTQPDKNTKVEPDELDFDFESIANKTFITFPKSCPANPSFSFAMPFVSDTFTLEFPLNRFCEAFGLFSYVVMLFGYIQALVIIGKG